MNNSRFHHIVLLLVCSVLTGCSGTTVNPGPILLGIDGIPCEGQIDHPPAGAIPIADGELLKLALMASGEGGLCAGEVFSVESPINIFRVWDSSNPAAEYGHWWSFNRPNVDRAEYRREEDICPDWSSLNRLSVCEIKTAAKFVTGPGQSAQCRKFSYPKSAINQVYIPINFDEPSLSITNCQEAVAWP